MRALWARTPDRGLRLRYRVDGPRGRLVTPAPTATRSFREGLWEHSCFELFLGLPGGEMYWEWNFSPSGEWALFEFDGPRRRSSPQPLAAAPALVLSTDGPGLELEAGLDLSFSPTLSWALQTGAPLEASITAVLEHVSGARSYWATAHAGGKPDFHRRDSFILRV